MSGPKLQLAAFAVVSALLSASAVSGAAPARTVTSKAQTHTAAKAATPNNSGQNAGNTTATALHQAHTLLANANHDYEGHRAKAAAHVTQAIHELAGHQHGANGTGHKGAAGAANNGAGRGNGNKEAQAQSDAQLRQAIQLLNGARGQLPNNHKAAAQIQSAITELNTALKIR